MTAIDVPYLDLEDPDGMEREAPLDVDVHLIHDIGVFMGSLDLLVVMRTRAARSAVGYVGGDEPRRRQRQAEGPLDQTQARFEAALS